MIERAEIFTLTMDHDRGGILYPLPESWPDDGKAQLTSDRIVGILEGVHYFGLFYSGPGEEGYYIRQGGGSPTFTGFEEELAIKPTMPYDPWAHRQKVANRFIELAQRDGIDDEVLKVVLY